MTVPWSLLEVTAQRLTLSAWHEKFHPSEHQFVLQCLKTKSQKLWLQMNIVSYNSVTDGEKGRKAKEEILRFLISYL